MELLSIRRRTRVQEARRKAPCILGVGDVFDDLVKVFVDYITKVFFTK
jgi:hypothetical protein